MSSKYGRVEKLRLRLLDAPHELCVERARLVTQAYRMYDDCPKATQFARAVSHVLKNLSVTIREDELIVGCRTGKLKAAPLYPENKCAWIEENLDGFEQRELQPQTTT